MNVIYISVGSKDEADGLTVQQAYVDGDGNFVGGQENMASLKAREDGVPISAEDYAAGFYKGKLITEQAFLTVQNNTSSARGYAGGVVTKKGQDAMQARRLQQKEVTNEHFSKRDEPIIQEAKMLNAVLPDATLKDLLTNRGMPEAVAEKHAEKHGG